MTAAQAYAMFLAAAIQQFTDDHYHVRAEKAANLADYMVEEFKNRYREDLK